MEERRISHRYRVPLPISVRLLPPNAAPGELHVTSRDVSTGGIYFTTDEALDVGIKLDLSLTLPSEITNGSAVTIDAQARVLRVDDRPGGTGDRYGIAATIDRLNVSRTAVDFALHKAEQVIERRRVATSLG